MTNEQRINELQKLLSTLAQLNESGYRCNTEIAKVIEAITVELGVNEDYAAYEEYKRSIKVLWGE